MTRSARPLSCAAVSLIAAVATLATGCAGGGGGGGGGARTGGGATSPGATGSGGSGGPSGPATSDFTAPSVVIVDPARAAYLTQAQVVVHGNVTDQGGSGVQSLSVNGRATTFAANGDWQASLTLDPGVNTIVAQAVDYAGNVGKTVVSVMYGDYHLATDDVPASAGTRVSEDTLNRIAPDIAQQVATSGIVQQKLTAGPLYNGSTSVFGVTVASATVDVLSASFDIPQIHFDTVPGGANALVHIPNLSVTARAHGTAAGIPYSVTGTIGASDAVIDTGLDIALGAAGNYVIASRYATVTLNGFTFGINGIPSILTSIVTTWVKSEAESRLADAVKAQLPSALASALASLAQPISRTWNGRTVTFRLTPDGLGFDDQGFTVGFKGNVTAARQPYVPVVPGSVFLPPPAGTLPALNTGAGFLATINENAMNRALFASWQAGFWNITVDQRFLSQFGTSLPFSLSGQLVAAFFPAIGAMLGNATVLPISLEFIPLMQPVLKVAGSPSLLTLQLGELHMKLYLDFGTGAPFEVLEVALHLEAATDVQVVNNAFVFSIGSTTRFEAELVKSAIPLNGVDVGRFLTFLVPPAIQVATQSIAPVPIPTFQGHQVANVRLYRDGYQGEFTTVSGDVQ
jgi:hypothetical protein